MKRHFQNILFFLPVFFSIAVFPSVLAGRSEEKNAFFLGFSKIRLLLIAASAALILFSILIFILRKKKLTFLFYFSGLAGIAAGELLLFSRFPCDDSRNLIPLIADRCAPLLWALTVNSLLWIFALRLSGAAFPQDHGFFLLVAAVLAYWGTSTHIDHYAWQIDLQGNSVMCLSVILSALLWMVLLKSETERKWKTAAGTLFFLLLGYCVTRSAGMWMGRGQTPPKAYWNELAEAFLQGRLYLEHPSGTHDLTLYNGKWYVPNPPLPAILLMPAVLIAGSAGAVNMCIYSALISGFNSGLMFLLLMLSYTEKSGPFSRDLPLVDKTSYPGRSLQIACWGTVLYIFGSDHLWLGTTGQMWFVSQLLVVMFTLLSCVFVVCDFSPIAVGVLFALGMACRPNIFPVWLCPLGLWLNRNFSFPRFKWKETFFWCLKSGIPVVISVALLLLYNKARFDNWMDFGYVTINGADWILESVQKWGMFHPHFLKINAKVMLFGLPSLDLSRERFFFQPHVEGYSIFLMTPPLIYVFRSFRKNWFAAGTWTSVLLSIGMLLLYHNTGAEQIGYRYLLDLAAPLCLLTAAGSKGKVSLLFKILTVFAVVLSFVAIYWWYIGRA